MDAMPRSPFVTLLLEWDGEEEDQARSGDILEVNLHDFDAELSTAANGPALRTRELWNLRNGPARGIAPRSYRVRVIGITETGEGETVLHVSEEPRGRGDYRAMPMPGA